MAGVPAYMGLDRGKHLALGFPSSLDRHPLAAEIRRKAGEGVSGDGEIDAADVRCRQTRDKPVTPGDERLSVLETGADVQPLEGNNSGKQEIEARDADFDARLDELCPFRRRRRHLHRTADLRAFRQKSLKRGKIAEIENAGKVPHAFENGISGPRDDEAHVHPFLFPPVEHAHEAAPLPDVPDQEIDSLFEDVHGRGDVARRPRATDLHRQPCGIIGRREAKHVGNEIGMRILSQQEVQACDLDVSRRNPEELHQGLIREEVARFRDQQADVFQLDVLEISVGDLLRQVLFGHRFRR
ncbi:MAG: hypothetical protein BWY66_01330 [bacterium ADurb.Bin374]|nr:MAG: hypothetical protein BWY66_01330 [bacterium ADurb.Bin374]